MSPYQPQHDTPAPRLLPLDHEHVRGGVDVSQDAVESYQGAEREGPAYASSRLHLVWLHVTIYT